MNRILVIDDDIELCELLSDYLTPEGFEVSAVHDGEAGAARALEDEPNLVVLDVMLPGMNGFEVLRKIRGRSNVAVIMLTARGDDVDRIVGLEMGADDYLPKPFNPRELVARIRAIQRRAESTPATAAEATHETLELGDLVVDKGTRTVKKNGRPVELTAVEFTLLAELLEHAGRIVTREDLSKKVLGRRLTPYDRSIDVHVSSLRKKLGHELAGTERIKTVRGVGYQYAQSAEGAISP
ncbi:DNA-binding response regulator [Desulfuromonas versatilis]|uniref:DNA-binding response regulator n=1 Tax=Desulfuromonas versatilis TaxID=2802975 RepID=A0ABM8HQZ5_9BACT|nr:response regulator transcription factor [Desulfuromonas versatilis]BCR04316.1 DNA-binding response regulator [Desulfuromonas versatilis]